MLPMTLIVLVEGWFGGKFLEGNGEDDILVTLVLSEAGATEAEKSAE